ncbi:hypothetical protein SAMN05660841_03246 [Sphingobacterium nematocida]|uniref:Uncharacterized protein n=1 Tax=Sphingobacterium nematocida TaxID=1513896 RepID=A0A1T5FH94_9SPHI|nr:hypothetical protein SAMN05660841_03246 [Sphingobacterium nematocida]
MDLRYCCMGLCFTYRDAGQNYIVILRIHRAKSTGQKEVAYIHREVRHRYKGVRSILMVYLFRHRDML